MPNRFRGVAMATIVVATVIVMFATSGRGPTSAQTAEAGDVAQGKYLIDDVAHCSGCHNTNLEGRAADPANPNFVPRPKIAGLPMFLNDADAVKFFEVGLLPGGVARARPPMPQFRFKHADALAVVAYLRSLK